MQAVVEVCGRKDPALARESGARLIQVNARDLDTLRVDRRACLELARQFPPEQGEIGSRPAAWIVAGIWKKPPGPDFPLRWWGRPSWRTENPVPPLHRLLHGREEGHHAA